MSIRNEELEDELLAENARLKAENARLREVVQDFIAEDQKAVADLQEMVPGYRPPQSLVTLHKRASEALANKLVAPVPLSDDKIKQKELDDYYLGFKDPDKEGK